MVGFTSVLFVCPAAITKQHRRQTLTTHTSGGWESEIKVPAPPGCCPPGSQRAAFPVSSRDWERGTEGRRRVSLLLMRLQSYTVRATPF